MQGLITVSVMDRGLRFPHGRSVLTHDDIRDELIRQINSGMLKQSDVAKALNIAPARVNEMRKGDRRVQPKEMPALARILGMIEGAAPEMVRSVETVEIPYWGKVAQGVWMEQSFADPENAEFVPYDMAPGDPSPRDLFAVSPEGKSMNLRFTPGMKLICRRVPFGSGQFKPGDLVIVERQAHELREMTCKRVEIDGDGVYWLHSESDQPQFKEPWRLGKPDQGMHVDNEITVLGKVIRGVVDYGQ